MSDRPGAPTDGCSDRRALRPTGAPTDGCSGRAARGALTAQALAEPEPGTPATRARQRERSAACRPPARTLPKPGGPSPPSVPPARGGAGTPESHQQQRADVRAQRVQQFVGAATRSRQAVRVHAPHLGHVCPRGRVGQLAVAGQLVGLLAAPGPRRLAGTATDPATRHDRPELRPAPAPRPRRTGDAALRQHATPTVAALPTLAPAAPAVPNAPAAAPRRRPTSPVRVRTVVGRSPGPPRLSPTPFTGRTRSSVPPGGPPGTT